MLFDVVVELDPFDGFIKSLLLVINASGFDLKLHSSHVQIVVNLDTVLSFGFTFGLEVFADSGESLTVKPVGELEIDIAVL